MKLSDGTILMHGHAPYDAQKAHEYYMRTRKLHPRQKHTTFTVTTASGGTEKLSAKDYAEQSAYANKRVAQIRANLSKLKTELAKKVAAAKVAKQNANKPLTAAEKAQKARDAKKYRQSHKQELKNKAHQQHNKSGGSKSGSSSSSSKTESIDSLKADIIVARDDLKAAVARQRSLAAAKKNG